MSKVMSTTLLFGNRKRRLNQESHNPLLMSQFVDTTALKESLVTSSSNLCPATLSLLFADATFFSFAWHDLDIQQAHLLISVSALRHRQRPTESACVSLS